MTKPSEITLQQFNDRKHTAELAIDAALDWFEAATGMTVFWFYLDRNTQNTFDCEWCFGEPAEEGGKTEELHPEAS
jgi:hypothetical protein